MSFFNINLRIITQEAVTNNRNNFYFCMLCVIILGINTRNWVDSAQDRDDWRTFVNAALKLQIS